MSRQKIGIGIIVIAVIALAIVMSGLLTIVNPTINFAGFTWQDSGAMYPQSGGAPPESVSNCGGGETNINLVGEALQIDIKSSVAIFRTITTDVTGIDELLIIYEGYGTVSCSNGQGNTGMGMSALVYGSDGGSVGDGIGVSTNRCPSGGETVSKTFQPAIWKLKNNFDGTWSSMTSIGVGDIFIVKSTQQVRGTKQFLKIELGGGRECNSGGYAQGSLKIYNVVRKENAFAVCKADKYAYDVNLDGKIAADGSECVDLATIVLNSEEAIKESFDEKLIRITAELEAKNAGLTADIDLLKQQLAEEQAKPVPTFDASALQSQITALQEELKQTKITLDAVQAGDKNVIDTVIAQEQFKEPSFLTRLWNSIIAFFKNLF